MLWASAPLPQLTLALNAPDLSSGSWRRKRTVKGSYFESYCSEWSRLICHCPHYDLIWSHSQRVTKQQMWLRLHDSHWVLCINLLSQAPSSAVHPLANPGQTPSRSWPWLPHFKNRMEVIMVGDGWRILFLFIFLVLFSLVFDLGMRKWGRGWAQIHFPQMIILP